MSSQRGSDTRRPGPRALYEPCKLLLSDLSAAINQTDYKLSLQEREAIAGMDIAFSMAELAKVLVTSVIGYHASKLIPPCRRDWRLRLGVGAASALSIASIDDSDQRNIIKVEGLLSLPTPIGGELDLMIRENPGIPQATKDVLLKVREPLYHNPENPALHLRIRQEDYSAFPGIARGTVQQAQHSRQQAWRESEPVGRDHEQGRVGYNRDSAAYGHTQGSSNAGLQNDAAYGWKTDPCLQDTDFSLGDGWDGELKSQGSSDQDADQDVGRSWRTQRERRDLRRQKRQENLRGESPEVNDGLGDYFDDRWDSSRRNR